MHHRVMKKSSQRSRGPVVDAMNIPNGVSSSPAAQAARLEHQTMTTTELIAQLQQIETSHGVLPIHIEIKTTVDLVDIGGNAVDTFGTRIEKCYVDEVHENCQPWVFNSRKAVWLIGQVI